MRKAKAVLLVILAVLVVSSAVFATAAWFKLFAKTYKPVADSALAKAKCAVCHEKKNGEGGLNPYGKLLKDKPVTPESLKAIESKDPDGDGATDIKEIKTGTLPGDPNSKPAGCNP